MAKKTVTQIFAAHKKEKQAMTNRHRKALAEQRKRLGEVHDHCEQVADKLVERGHEVHRLSELLDKAKHSPNLIQQLIKTQIPAFNKCSIGIVVEGGYVYALKDSIEVKWAFGHVMKYGLQALLRMFTPIDTEAAGGTNNVNGTIIKFDAPSD